MAIRKYKNLYEITFRFRQHGWHARLIHIEAFNMKDAIKEAKRLWQTSYTPHMFNVEARRVPLDECVDMAHWFVPDKRNISFVK